MPHITIIGAGITGITTAYELLELGYQVTVLDKHLYPAMETSFANGGQLSACNAEVWNQKSTVLKGIKWMTQKDAPLLLNPSFSLHKYAWLLEFLGNIKHYEGNTEDTVKLALIARKRLFEIAEKEHIQFDLEKKGILHFYHTQHDYDVAIRVNDLLCKGGLVRHAVDNNEIHRIEPALKNEYFGGFYCPDDATGDIHKYTTGLAKVVQAKGGRIIQGVEVTKINLSDTGVELIYQSSDPKKQLENSAITADAMVICGGVSSYELAQQVGDRVNVYPVKGYSITVQLNDEKSQNNAPWVSLLDESAKIVTSRFGLNRFRIAGTAEFNGYNRDIRMDRIQPLIQWVNRNFDVSTEHCVPWAGLRPMMPNMMPVVRRGKHSRVFYNTGHGHLGWTLSAATAAISAQQIATQYPI